MQSLSTIDEVYDKITVAKTYLGDKCRKQENKLQFLWTLTVQAIYMAFS